MIKLVFCASRVVRFSLTGCCPQQSSNQHQVRRRKRCEAKFQLKDFLCGRDDKFVFYVHSRITITQSTCGSIRRPFPGKIKQLITRYRMVISWSHQLSSLPSFFPNSCSYFIAFQRKSAAESTL